MTEKIEPIEPENKGVLGNTKTKTQANQCKKWCFTLNNYTKNEYLDILDTLESKKIDYIIGEEIGEQGTPHLQGYIESPKKIRWTELKLTNKIHWEVARGSRDKNIIYCSKEGKFKCTRKLKPITTITKLYDWQQNIVNLYNTEPDGRSVYWYVDEVGGKGKSSFCKYMYIKYDCITIQGGKLADIMNIIFNLKDIPKMLIIDVPRCNTNKVSYSAIECILNGMITNTKFETGIKVFNPPHVLVFSNYYPDDSKLSEDRWNIIEL